MEQYEIEVTVISPGYIHTNLSVNAVTADGSKYGGEALVSLFSHEKLSAGDSEMCFSHLMILRFFFIWNVIFLSLFI